ncbi:MAG: hypothetical protein OXC03_04380 [Flavobacteriaceae bacterium]|nr:hypothetical protein [Flavobacteriaceae bacterium]
MNKKDNKERMLKLVLSDENLSSIYQFNAEDYSSLDDAFYSDNIAVVSVAKIIDGISDKRSFTPTYNDVRRYLNQNV